VSFFSCTAAVIFHDWHSGVHLCNECAMWPGAAEASESDSVSSPMSRLGDWSAESLDDSSTDEESDSTMSRDEAVHALDSVGMTQLDDHPSPQAQPLQYLLWLTQCDRVRTGRR